MEPTTTGPFLGFVILAIAFAMYMLPAIVAHRRKHASAGGITVLNLLLGWTMLGWVLSLVWACSATGRPAAVEHRA